MKFSKLIPPGYLSFLIIAHFAFAIYSDPPIKTSREMIQFPEKKNCAAWYSIKSMIFTSRSAMAGLNCEVSINFGKSDNGYKLTAEAPLSGFDSGQKGRDKYFRNALQESVRPSLRFESPGLGKGQWQEIFNGQVRSLSGELFIGAKSFPVTFTLEKNGDSIKGMFVGKYDDFGMVPHTVGPFGMIAKSENHLEIHFQLYTKSPGLDL